MFSSQKPQNEDELLTEADVLKHREEINIDGQLTPAVLDA